MFSEVEVAEEWTMSPFQPRSSTIDDPFGRMPIWARLGGGLAAVAVGTAPNMIARFLELACRKIPVGNIVRLSDRAPAQMAIGEAQGLYQAARALVMDTADSTWQRAVDGRPFDDTHLAQQRAAYVTAVRLAARAVDLLHDAAGMTAVANDNVLERCWRDVHTMTQHTNLSPARYEIVGRVLLGLDPGSPTI